MVGEYYLLFVYTNRDIIFVQSGAPSGFSVEYDWSRTFVITAVKSGIRERVDVRTGK